MVLKKWLNEIIENHSEVKKLRENLIRLETKVEMLENQKQEGRQQQPPQEEVPKEPPPTTTFIENLKIDHIYVDHMEHNNNFGALGIKSLEGKLNIGANYGIGEDMPQSKKKKADDKQEKYEKQMKELVISKKKQKKEAKMNIQPSYKINPRHTKPPTE